MSTSIQKQIKGVIIHKRRNTQRPNGLQSWMRSWCWSPLALDCLQNSSFLGRSQDGGGVGWGEHFLPHKFIKRAFKRRVNSTKQLLNAGRGHQAPKKQPNSSKGERRNTAPSTRTSTQASLTRKPWQATCTNPHTARKCHNKENSTHCQNTERTPQTQQFKQDEETEEYPADKGTG